MSNGLSMNVFNVPGLQKGELAMNRLAGANISCTVDVNQSVNLVPGQAVKLVSYGDYKSPIMVAAADATDDIFGFVIRDRGLTSYAAKQQLNLTLEGSIMIMEAAGALTTGTRVGIVAAGQKIQDATDMTITPIGILLDRAVAEGDLVRVLVQVPGRYTSAMLALV